MIKPAAAEIQTMAKTVTCVKGKRPPGVFEQTEDDIGPDGPDTGSMAAHKQTNNKVAGHARVANKMGLHARPAMQFVDLANTFSSKVRVCKGQQCVNAKSIMELLLLAAGEGSKLTIHAEGPDAHAAVDALTKLVAGNFDEE